MISRTTFAHPITRPVVLIATISGMAVVITHSRCPLAKRAIPLAVYFGLAAWA